MVYHHLTDAPGRTTDGCAWWRELQTRLILKLRIVVFLPGYGMSGMEVLFACPRCQQTNRQPLPITSERIECPCGWSRPQPVTEGEGSALQECVICGCSDLWRQKDFPQKLGLFCVGLAALLSTLAWWFYEPMWAIGILLAFAAADLLLFLFMKDVLVCYRCAARYRQPGPLAETAPFNLETAERYRQEAARIAEMAAVPSAGKPADGLR